jgi:hypothetical protein
MSIFKILLAIRFIPMCSRVILPELMLISLRLLIVRSLTGRVGFWGRWCCRRARSLPMEIKKGGKSLEKK